MPEPDAAPAQPAPDADRESGLPPVSPDFVEAEMVGAMDNIIPSRGYEMMPMIGLGGSAGSIGALRQFFEKMPEETGLCFVVILHLSPEHESTLAEMLQRTTKMRVEQAIDGEKVHPNCVYVIPPGKHLASVDGHLRLADLPADRGPRVAVDYFFRTLADSHGPHAAAIVLSGADGDGAIGMKRIKERGGLTIAQDPSEAKHDSMPRSALETGMVDWVLKVAEMPERIAEYFRQDGRRRLPPEEGPQPAKAIPKAPSEEEKALREVLLFLRARTGRDFSYYKRATIVRRIARRVQINSLRDLTEYLAFLRTNPGEAGALLQDLLISVTNFFRDREAFEALQATIPEIMAGKRAGDAVRVWVAACATGEEAYSIAMLLNEEAGLMDSPPAIQVFATDLDEAVIEQARAGLYPLAIAADVSEDRLRRFFTKESRGYRVRRELRESVLFAVHDLLKDSPFSRLDLASCRNLLIYLTREAQKRVFEIFHFSLRDGGRLFLGTSENVDDESTLFSVLDKKHRLYARRTGARAGLPMPGPASVQRVLESQERARSGIAVAGNAFLQSAASQQRDAALTDARRISWEELHFRLIERFAAPSLIVDRDYNIMHVSENAGRFLHFASGEPSVNLLRVVHPMLRVELRAALFRAAQTATTVEAFRVPMDADGAMLTVDIRVSPAQEIAPDYLLVVFSPREVPRDAAETPTPPPNAEPAVRHLERELEQMKSHLRDTVEQYEAGTEELKASNEELLAMNEELRSATEELETGREELQSINEELITVNQELKSKVDELAHANSDMQNLMTATAIATVFLDRSLRIMRFTPLAAEVFRMIPGDIGRPLADLQHTLEYPTLLDDARRVLESLIPIEREVAEAGGRWFLLRLLPYRTMEDQIAGLVLTLVDITDNRRVDEERRVSEQRAQALIANLPGGAAFVVDHDLRYLLAAGEALHTAGLNPEDLVGKTVEEALGAERAGRYNRYYRMTLAGESFAVEHEENGRSFITRGVPLRDKDGAVEAALAISFDISDRKQAEDALGASQEQLRLIMASTHEHAIFATDLDRYVTSWNSGAAQIFGISAEEAIGHPADLIFTPEDRAQGAPSEEAQTALREGRAADERWHLRRDGSRFWGRGVMLPIRPRDGGEAIGLVKILRDETAARESRQALEQSRTELWAALQETERARAEAEAAGQAKDHFLAVLSHELRTPLTPVLMAVRAMSRNPEMPPAAMEALEMIRRNVQIEAHFIDDLLDLTRIARGKLEMVLEPVDLHRAIEHAAEVSAGDLEGKDQRLTVDLRAGRHELSGDSTRLQQVFWNLLKNSSKFTPKGGEIRVTSRNEGDEIVVDIADTGIGFEPEVGARIFDAFAQANQAITREFGGLGLGLAISKATAEGHGGSITATSQGPGQGATFSVRLPLGGLAREE